jgi:UDP-2,3-diacylglucosamine hydrolase
LHVFAVSDLHIDAGQPAIGAQFIEFLEGPARAAHALYVLGDLFESWIGDDDDDPHRGAVLDALRRLTDAGVALYVMAGNRDFLYGPAFEQRTGAVLLPDPCVVTRFGQRVLVTHGDALCTDDVPYQRLRAMVRDSAWQRRFLALPRSARALMAGAARAGSQSHTKRQAAMLMDVNAAAVTTALREAGVDTLLHGHTHRPARHELSVSGRPCVRWVLGDWNAEPVLARWDATGLHLQTRSGAPFGDSSG